ncbi:MAG: alternative ribosome rescue aminoacyl-tRNA hydrolase ArfB [Myxococcota bacterium]
MDDLHIQTDMNALVIPARDLSWTAARASGPGGQNVNRVASKVDLRFDLPANRSLRADLRARLRERYATRLDADGRLVVVSQSARTQAGNLSLARERLAALVAAAAHVPKTRRATKPTRGSIRRRIDAKKRVGQKKSSRGRRWRADD